MSVDLELYKVFYTVGKTGNLTRAAKKLFITQPAVSQSIKQLETQLGGRLFVRTPKGMRLTEDEGEMMFGYIEKAIELIRAAENKFLQMKNLAIGTLHIGASDSIIKYHLLQNINRFHKKHPHIRIQLTNSTSNAAIELLKAGMVDVAFVNLPVDERSLDIKFCAEVNDCFVASGDKYAHLAQTVMPLHSLSENTFMMLDKNSNTRKNVINFLKERGIDITPDIELGSLDLLIEFALSGLGIACVVKEYVTDELASGKLIEIKTDPALPQRGIGLATIKNIPTSFAVGEFIKLFGSGSVTLHSSSD